MTKSVCIIGAGIGGLTAGAYLAQSGYKVTIYEKATTVGGSAGAYTRHKRTFPTGATVGFGLEESGVLSDILKDLQITIPLQKLDHPMDVILPSGKVSIYQDSSLWEKELRLVQPVSQENILKFWNMLEQISSDVEEIVKQRISLPIQSWSDVQRLAKLGVISPIILFRLARFALWSVEDLMKKCKVKDIEPLRQFIDAQLMDAVQTDSSKAALLPSSLALSIYRRGSFSIDGGFSTLCKALAKRIEELGGTIKLATSVKEIQYIKETEKWDVRGKRLQELFDIVINNSGVSFGEGTSYMKEEAFSWGAFRIDAILERQVISKLNSSMLPFAYQIVLPENRTKNSSKIHGPLYVTFHESRDSLGNIVKDEVMMTASIHTDARLWKSYSKEQYVLEKDKIYSEMLEVINRVIPINPFLKYAEAGTPLTYLKYMGKTEVGGFPLDVMTAVIRPKSFRTKNNHFYIVGEQVFPGPGTLSSALSGYYAARAIMKHSKIV
ncbi:phytoene desaturase family protein [Bacillus pinisoli]|uniref:phytoene desaturase family protein n=1 Tax=Bacillus pinisoli TaxID=2901866 RepID=UPI001FF6193C